MRNHQHSRLLTNLVLVAAMSVALGSEALAGSFMQRSQTKSSLQSGIVPRPGSTPMVGEPDAGGFLPPPPPKIGPNPSGSRPTTMADWTLRIHWMFRNLLLQTPKRFP
jgi:hypothetical protein